eukprot:m.427037 g.427037  ORF g.427037 m.427037 type:complete len:256 (+) comp61577_c0_seq1:57-824(+)
MSSKRRATSVPLELEPTPAKVLRSDVSSVQSELDPAGALLLPPPPTRVLLRCDRVLSSSTVKAAVDAVPGDGPVVVCVHPGTRGYGSDCFDLDQLRDRLVAVERQGGCPVGWRMLRRLVVAIGMYELNLTQTIRSLVPEEPQTARVGPRAFFGCRLLERAFIPPVTSIATGAFHGCHGLTVVAIPDTVTSIGTAAFRDCVGLISVAIPDSVTSIGIFAFKECSGLTSVELPHALALSFSELWAFKFPAGIPFTVR